MPQHHIATKEKKYANAILLPQVIGLLDEGHTVTLKLRGYSMRPFLEDNRDKALLSKAQKPHVGDVVLAEISPQHYVLHRITRIRGNHITLQGDGNLNTEECEMENIKGFAIGFYRKGRQTLDKTNGLKWRIYSALWIFLRPIRRYLLAFHRRIWLKAGSINCL